MCTWLAHLFTLCVGTWHPGPCPDRANLLEVIECSEKTPTSKHFVDTFSSENLAMKTHSEARAKYRDMWVTATCHLLTTVTQRQHWHTCTQTHTHTHTHTQTHTQNNSWCPISVNEIRESVVTVHVWLCPGTRGIHCAHHATHVVCMYVCVCVWQTGWQITSRNGGLAVSVQLPRLSSD